MINHDLYGIGIFRKLYGVYIVKMFGKKMEEFINHHEIFVIVFLMVVFSLFLSWPLFTTYPLHTTTDELGTIVGAASLAGYDWSGVIDKSGYYGFGYYIIFAPLFMLHLSPIMIYRIILVFTRCLRECVIFSISYYIGKYYLGFSSKAILLQVAIICTIPLHPNNDTNIINDVVLDIMLWIIIILVCKMAEHIECLYKYMLYFFAYIAAVFYASLLHTRALAMIIASFISVLGILIYKRKKRLFWSIIVIPIILLARKFIELYQNGIWRLSGGKLINASVRLGFEWNMIDAKAWNIWFDMLIGHISVQSLLTGGLFLAAVVAIMKYIFDAIKETKKANIYLNIIITISGLAVGATFAAFLVSSWFSEMYSTWNTNEMGTAYCYKALCYVRYWNVFSMPFILAGIYLLEKKEYRSCIRKAIYGWIIMIFLFIHLVVPIIKENEAAAGFLFTYLSEKRERITAEFYYKCILYCAIFMFFSCIIYYGTKYKSLAVTPIVMLLLIGYQNANVNYNEPIREDVSSMVLASYAQKELLEQANINIGHIFAYDDRKVDQNWYVFSVLQFYFYEYRIEDDYPDLVQANDIIVTYDRNPKIEKDFPNLSCYVLDDNEVWYTELKLIGYDSLW